MTQLAFSSSIAFIHYNLASNKARVRESFIENQQQKLFSKLGSMEEKEHFDDLYFKENYEYLASSIDC